MQDREADSSGAHELILAKGEINNMRETADTLVMPHSTWEKLVRLLTDMAGMELNGFDINSRGILMCHADFYQEHGGPFKAQKPNNLLGKIMHYVETETQWHLFHCQDWARESRALNKTSRSTKEGGGWRSWLLPELHLNRLAIGFTRVRLPWEDHNEFNLAFPRRPTKRNTFFCLQQDLPTWHTHKRARGVSITPAPDNVISTICTCTYFIVSCNGACTKSMTLTLWIHLARGQLRQTSKPYEEIGNAWVFAEERPTSHGLTRGW